jgi:RHS repeat-associated protein
MSWFHQSALRRLALTTTLSTAWLTVGPSVGSAAALGRSQASKQGHQRALTLLELQRIQGAQAPGLGPGAGVSQGAAVDRNVDGQTGTTFPWEGGMEGLNTVNGNKLTELYLTGWRVQGGMHVSLAIYHNSLGDLTSALGSHWGHSYQISGTVHPLLGDFTVRWGDGLGYTFTRNIDGSFATPQGIDDTLAQEGTGYTLTTRDQVRYHFENGQTVWIKDRSDNQITIAHGADGQVSSVTDPSGRSLTFTYSGGKLVSVSDPAGRVFTFTQDANDDLVAVGFPLSSSMAYGYDSQHRIVSITDARGKVWTRGYTALGNALAWEKDPMNHQRTYSYGPDYTEVTDSLGHVTRHNYGPSGQLVSLVAPGNRTTTLAYTGYRLASVTSPSGATSSVTYDTAGNVLTCTDPLGNTTSYAYNSRHDLISLVTPMGKLVTVSYDSMGRLIGGTDPLGHSSSYTLNSSGQPISFTNARGKTRTVSYDLYGNAISTTDALGHTTTTSYNILGMPLTTTDPTGKAVSTSYDSLGRVVGVTAPGNRTTSFAYDGEGHLLSETNALGQVSYFSYNDSGALVQKVDPLGRAVSYSYNAIGQRTGVTDGRGKLTTYSYNSLGELASIAFPDNASLSATYNADGQVATRTDGRGIVASNSYDLAGKLTQVTYSDGTPSVSFSYNADSLRTSMVDGTGMTSYSYDGAGNLTNRTSPQGAVSYSYDATNEIIGKVGGGTTVLYNFDDAGRMSSLVAGGTQTTSYSYDTANRLTGTVRPDGSAETRSYDSTSGELKSIVSKKSAVVIASSLYSYDALGRKISEVAPDYQVAYGYDSAGQLTSESRAGTGAYSISYSYDDAGNRLTKTQGGIIENYLYDNANKLLSAGGKSYAYDAAGNMTSVSWNGGSTSLTWDGESRLKSSLSSNSTVNYTYNGLGQRVGKSGGTSASYLLSDDSIDSNVVSDGAASFVRGAAGLLSEKRSGVQKFYHTDALGSVRALTNGSGTLTDTRSTDAFGMTVTSSGTTATPFGLAGNYNYHNDPETGLKRLGHRMYDASTGRFISRDPILAGDNWYAYAANDPINGVDPEGLDYLKVELGPIKPGTGGDGVGYREGRITWVKEWDQYDWKERTWPIRSGGYRDKNTLVPRGESTSIPPGNYTVNHPQPGRTGGYKRGDIGFTFDISDPPKRSDLRIHPDGNKPGTEGCIGIVSDGQDLGDFYDKLRDYIKDHGRINMKVIITPDTNLKKNKTIGDESDCKLE